MGDRTVVQVKNGAFAILMQREQKLPGAIVTAALNLLLLHPIIIAARNCYRCARLLLLRVIMIAWRIVLSHSLELIVIVFAKLARNFINKKKKKENSRVLVAHFL